MNVLAIALIIFGGFWIFGRILNQPAMFNIVKRKIKTNGLLYGIWCYLRGEIFGFGLGIGLIILGIYLYR